MAANNGKTYEFANFRLIPHEGLLLRNGEQVSLPLKAFSTLVLLVERHGHLVERSELIEAVWQDAFVEEGNISKCVWAIRNALGEVSKSGKFIQTVPRRGYRFVAPVSIVSEGSGAFRLPLVPEDVEIGQQLPALQTRGNGNAEGNGAAPNIAGLSTFPTNGSSWNAVISDIAPANLFSPGLPFLSGQRRWFVYVGILAMFLAGTALYLALAGLSPLGSGKPDRIAVLPLKPVDVRSRDTLFDLGIAEALILKLGSRKELKVSPLNAVRGYIDVNADPLTAGKEQNVDYVLSANYQIAGGRIKVTAQFVEVATGNVVGTFQADQPLDPSFAAQDRIANDIGNKLLARFGSDTGDFRSKRGTDDLEAYRLYMMGMNLSEERGVQNVKKALEYLERAVELDPNYAIAWAGLAHLHRDMVGHGDPDARGHYERSMQAIEKALEIDPNSSEAYSALCHNKNRYEYDAAGAEAACKHALELDPDSPQAHKTYANFLYSRGRFDESIAHITRAMDIQPVSYKNQQSYGLALFYARRFDEAEAQFKRLLELNPNHYWIHAQLVTILEAQGKEAEAFEFLIQSLIGKKTDNRTVERFKAAYARSGWHGVTLERINAAGESRPFELASLYARLGDKDRAFEYLEKAYQERSFLIAILRVAPQLDPLRDDPRFESLLARVEQR